MQDRTAWLERGERFGWAEIFGVLRLRSGDRVWVGERNARQSEGRSRFPEGMTEERQMRRSLRYASQRQERDASVEMTELGWREERRGKNGRQQVPCCARNDNFFSEIVKERQGQGPMRGSFAALRMTARNKQRRGQGQVQVPVQVKILGSLHLAALRSR